MLGAGRPGLHPRQCAGKSLIATRLNTRLVNSAMEGGMGGAQDDPYQVMFIRNIWPGIDSTLTVHFNYAGAWCAP